MDSSIEVTRGVNGNGPRQIHKTGIGHRQLAEYAPGETELSDLLQAESRIEALRLLVLTFLREVDSLKKAVAMRPRKKRERVDLEGELEAFEASLIREALIRTNGNQRDAARLLRIKPTTLNAKMKRLGITIKTTVTSVE